MIVSKNSDNPRTRPASGLSSAVMVFAAAFFGGLQVSQAWTADQRLEVESATKLAAMSNASEINADGVTVYQDDDKDSDRMVLVAYVRDGAEKYSSLHSCGHRTSLYALVGSDVVDFEVDPAS